MSFQLGYWDIRGLAAPARMMLEYAEADYEDVQYSKAAAWLEKAKPALAAKNPLINLPYVIHGDEVVTQSNVVFDYLGDKLGINDAKNNVKNAQIREQVMDLRNSVIELVYPFKQVNRNKEEFEKNRAKQIASVAPGHYAKFEAWLKFYGTPYFCGDKISSSDFHVFEMLDQHELLAKSFGAASPVENFPLLKAFHANILKLPTLQKYFASAAYKLPVNNSLGGAYWL